MDIKRKASNQRWAIFIDIEGFSYFQSDMERYHSVDTLLCGLYLIGNKVFIETSERLFVHHIGGDGFLIVSDHPEEDLSRAISIATVLLRYLLLDGFVGKAAISTGDWADISSCWPGFCKLIEKDSPKKVTEMGTFTKPAFHNGSAFSLGDGTLRSFTVMGTALINTYHLLNKAKGPVLIIDPNLKCMIPEGFKIVKNNDKCILLSWIDLNNDLISTIANSIENKDLLDLDTIRERLENYIKYKSEGVSEDWVKNAKLLL